MSTGLEYKHLQHHDVSILHEFHCFISFLKAWLHPCGGLPCANASENVTEVQVCGLAFIIFYAAEEMIDVSVLYILLHFKG